MSKNLTENKRLKTCQATRYDDSPCGRPLYDNKHCIFHSEAIEKKEFNGVFWKEFERQKKEDNIYDFSRFIFPDSTSFKKIKFEKPTNFSKAIFLGEETSFD